MSEELQNGDVAPEIDAPNAENQNTGAELAPDSGGEHEKQPQVDEVAAKNAATQKVISEKHFQAKQAERERDEALAKLAEREEKDRTAEAARAGDIPDLPNEFDDNFREKMAERDEALVRKTRFEESQANFLEQQRIQQEQAQQQAQAEYQKKANAYNARAAELGIDTQELDAAGNAVMSFGVSSDLATHILGDNDGPLITKYLAENSGDLMTLVNMSPFQQGAFLDQIKVKAAELKPKPTNTLPPQEILTGSGAAVDTGKYPNSAGATFS